MNAFMTDVLLEEFGFDPNSVEITNEIITDCSHQGQCDEDVEYWSEKLELASKCRRGTLQSQLREYGAWSIEELEAMSNEDLCQKALWIICCDSKEYAAQQPEDPEEE